MGWTHLTDFRGSHKGPMVISKLHHSAKGEGRHSDGVAFVPLEKARASQNLSIAWNPRLFFASHESKSMRRCVPVQHVASS